MLVNPGFGGQKTIVSQIDKLRNIRNTIKAKKKEILLEVDGCVNIKNSNALVEAGADILVAGSSIFKGGNSKYNYNIRNLRNSWRISENKKFFLWNIIKDCYLRPLFIIK